MSTGTLNRIFQEASHVARARARAYALLALALRPPTAEMLEQLSSGEAWRDFLALCPEGRLTERLHALSAASRPFRTPGDEGENLLAVRILYTRLFDAPGAPVPPYGSIYLDGELMGPSAVAALAAYTRVGLAPADDLGDLPDHAAVEAEFLSSDGGHFQHGPLSFPFAEGSVQRPGGQGNLEVAFHVSS